MSNSAVTATALFTLDYLIMCICWDQYEKSQYTTQPINMPLLSNTGPVSSNQQAPVVSGSMPAYYVMF